MRPAVPDDAATLIAYINQVAGESDNLTFGHGEFTVSEEEERTILQNMAEARNQLYLLAMIDGSIVGSLTFRGGPKKRTAHAGEFGITVQKTHWGKGIGRLMLQYLFEWAKETGTVRKINLRVRSDNERGIRLYKSLGFVEEGLLRREFFIDGVFYDAYLMGLLLD